MISSLSYDKVSSFLLLAKAQNSSFLILQVIKFVLLKFSNFAAA